MKQKHASRYFPHDSRIFVLVFQTTDRTLRVQFSARRFVETKPQESRKIFYLPV
jgi:hypothetical protein